MFKGPQGMSLPCNSAAAAATATSTATSAADKTKIYASSLIFRVTKWCFSLASGAMPP